MYDARPTALLPFRRKSYSGFLRSEEIHGPRPGLNPRTSELVASMITTGPPGSTFVYVRHRQSCTQWGLASMTLQGKQVHPPPSMPSLQCILNDQRRTVLAYLLGNMSLSKQARKRTFQESWEEKYFCCSQDHVRCLLCSIVQKALINGASSDIMILYSVASPPLTLPTYPFSHYVLCIAGCVVRRHREATLSTWLPRPDYDHRV